MYNPFSLEGKTILVTGSTSGIGRGVAIECSKMGARVIVTGRNQERLEETVCQLEGSNHIALTADLATQEGVEKLVEACPQLNGCVLNAGMPKVSTIKHMKRMDLEEIISVNEIAPIMLTSLLTKKKKLEKNSSIVFISSPNGVQIALNGNSAYAATKGAISAFMKTAAMELSTNGTRVNAILPGLVPTRILELSNSMTPEDEMMAKKASRYPLGFGTPEDIAFGCIYFLSDAGRWVTGVNLFIDGGRSID